MRHLVLAVLLLAGPRDQTPRPTVDVSPRFIFAGGAVRVLARKHSTEEVVGGPWCLMLWSEESTYERASCEDTEGADSVRQVYEGIPAGHYTVNFKVRYSNGQERLAVATFCSNGGDISCSEDPHQP